MQVQVHGAAPPDPFLSARDVFETEYDLELRVEVRIRTDPDERTWAGHYEDRHVLNVSRSVAGSAMARELALHEYAHMHRYESDHPSHHQSTREALFLALTGRSVERRCLAHCYQIANHMKDIYADDLTVEVGRPEKLVAFLESGLATAVADRPGGHPRRPDARLATPGADPDITAVNAAFALALCERHDLVGADHRLYDLAHAAARDAPHVDLGAFKRRFRTLAADPDESEYRQTLVETTRDYAVGTDRAAD